MGRVSLPAAVLQKRARCRHQSALWRQYGPMHTEDGRIVLFSQLECRECLQVLESIDGPAPDEGPLVKDEDGHYTSGGDSWL